MDWDRDSSRSEENKIRKIKLKKKKHKTNKQENPSDVSQSLTTSHKQTGAQPVSKQWLLWKIFVLPPPKFYC